jgi:hypothetical protein
MGIGKSPTLPSPKRKVKKKKGKEIKGSKLDFYFGFSLKKCQLTTPGSN